MAGTDVGIHYDYLVLAAGSTHSYFGHDDWETLAPGLKTIEDATEMRRRFLLAFESAEQEADPAARKAALTFVIVGGGPTGVELAGSMAEIARSAIPEDFRMIDTATTRIMLIEGLPRLLSAFPKASSQASLKQLKELGVEVLLNTRVTSVDANGVQIGESRIDATNVFWAAGVKASPLGNMLGVETDNAGHVKVLPDLSIPNYPEVFVAGDLATVIDSKTNQPVPHVAQGGLQMGKYIGAQIAKEIAANNNGKAVPERKPFQYYDKGNLATIGRNRAVADIRGWKFSGIFAWLLWALVHVTYLITFRSRFSVMISWIWQYIFYDRGARLITGNSRVSVKIPRDPDA
jgi:NADH dehydrogenase